MRDWAEEVRRRLAFGSGSGDPRSGSGVPRWGSGRPWSRRIPPPREAEIVEEWARHLEDRFVELAGRGMTKEEAEAAVLAELDSESPGGRGLGSALGRAHRREPPRPAPLGGGGAGGFLPGLLQDLRYAGRTLRLDPGFTLAAGLTLALAIGALTATFSVVDGVLLRPLPYADGERIVRLFESDRNSQTTREGFSAPDLFDLKERARTVESVAAYQTLPRSLGPGALAVPEAGGGDAGAPSAGGDAGPATPEGVGGGRGVVGVAGAERVLVTAASYDLFPLLGIRPLLGRWHAEAEDAPGGEAVALLSEEQWRRRFGGDPAIVGGTIRLDGLPHTVIGVMPASFAFPSAETEVWVPLRATPTSAPRGQHSLAVVARLAEDATLESAGEELGRIAAELEALHPEDNLGRGMRAEPLGDVLFGNVRTPLLLLLAAVVLVLLIACANVANLLLARGAARAREVAVRTALGASTGRLARQFAAETLLLTILAGAAGVLLARPLLGALVTLVPGSVPRLASVGIDGRVLAAVAGTLLLVGLVFGLVPTLQARRPDVRAGLAGAGAAGPGGGRGGRAGAGPVGGGGRGGRGGRSAQGALVAAEIALAVMLVSGAALLVHSFWRLSAVDPGFRAERLVKFDFVLPATRYPQAIPDFPNFPEARAFFRDVQGEVEALPGVVAAAFAVHHPLNPGWTTSYRLEGQTEEAARSQPEVVLRPVSHGYFETVGARLVRGRTIERRDEGDAPGVAVVNEAFARAHAGDGDILGRRIGFFSLDVTIVGVVADERFAGPAGQTPRALYPSLQQVPLTGGSLLVRAAVAPERIVPTVRSVFGRIDPELAVYGVETLEETLRQGVAQPRFTMLLLSAFGVLALALAAIGVHGVLAYAVSRRTREIGIRMALGAPRSRVVALVIRQGMRPALLGLVLGLAGALAAGRLLESMLFGVRPSDPPTFAAVAVALGGVALAACWLPARRAARIDPIETLREE